MLSSREDEEGGRWIESREWGAVNKCAATGLNAHTPSQNSCSERGCQHDAEQMCESYHCSLLSNGTESYETPPAYSPDESVAADTDEAGGSAARRLNGFLDLDRVERLLSLFEISSEHESSQVSSSVEYKPVL